MNIVNLEAAVKAYGSRVLLDHVSLGVAAGERIGVVGRNGAGKTTLLTALAGLSGLGGLDSGRSTRARDVSVGYLPQAQELSGTVRDIVLGSLPEHEWAADARVRGIVGALLGDMDTGARAEGLSGGERRRTGLAAVLRGPHDLLLLDEPTNHLDIEGIRWLAGYLIGYGRAVVVVTHDRWFLDEVCERTWEVAAGQVNSYDGGYSAYVLARTERNRLAGLQDQRRRNLLRKELAWLRRGPPARTSKPKFRLEAASALIAGEPPARDSVELNSLAAARLGRTVIDLAGVSVSVAGRRLLDDVTWQLGPGDRVGLVGVNGSGKTTFLNLLAGLVGTVAETGGAGQAGRVARLSHSGDIVTGTTVRLGYLTQEPGPVEPDLRVLEAAQRVRGSIRVGKRELTASQLLDRLGLTGDRQRARVADLSGGERRRLQLQTVLMDEPNVLLLDEPTNDLDIDTLTELEDLLDGFPGSIVVVSHDRYFTERVTDHVLALVDGKLAFLPGGIDEYLALRDAGLAGKPARPAPDRTAAAGPVPARASAGEIRAAKKELARLDRQIARLSARESELHEDLAQAASDYERLVALGDELKAVQTERTALEDRWLEVSDHAG